MPYARNTYCMLPISANAVEACEQRLEGTHSKSSQVWTVAVSMEINMGFI